MKYEQISRIEKKAKQRIDTNNESKIGWEITNKRNKKVNEKNVYFSRGVYISVIERTKKEIQLLFGPNKSIFVRDFCVFFS